MFDIASYNGTRSTPPYSLWMLVELLEAQSWLTPYLHPMPPLAESHQETTGAVFVLGSRFNSAELYATPALFRQLWPKLLYATAVEALVEQKQGGKDGMGALLTKGEVTAWLAAGHRREAMGYTDKINKGIHRRIRSSGRVFCFETMDMEQDGICVHETILPNE